GFTRPLYLDIIASAALPGMRRGIRKFSVIAAHSVTTKNPSLRRTNLTFRAPCSGSVSSTADHLGFRCRANTPQSGVSYAAGLANGSFCVTQPVTSLVLYWYQSTPSVIGITGTSLTITASSCLMIACWVATFVVAP